MNTQRKNHFQNRNREGITLLFVISMVVLFLLMGTTFVVVSNDYFKAARRRSRLSTNVVDNEALLDRAFFQLMREVPLADSSSPLRGHSILGDQYGYGFKSRTTAVTVGSAISPFVNVTLNVNGIDPEVFGRIRVPGLPVVLRTDSEYYDGQFNGQVFSILEGPLRGTSTRIVNSELVMGADESQDTLVVTIPKGGQNWNQLGNDVSVLINGKDFGGTGAGDTTQLNFMRNNFDTFAVTEVLGENALEVNQQGRPFESRDFTVTGFTGPADANYVNVTTDSSGTPQLQGGYLSLDNSTNEPYDIADFQNMFLSGIDGAGNIIPSFHRDRLLIDRITTAPSPNRLKQFTFRPVFIEDTAADDNTELNSTANREFFDEFLADSLMLNGTFRTSSTPNAPQNLDVDSDGDGELDSVWIDIGLPTQIDSQGVRFRPLVAYRVVDMDGRLNVNTHGSEIDALMSAGGASLRTGNSYDGADISLAGVVTSPADYLGLVNSRTLPISVPVNGDDRRLRSGQKLFDWLPGTVVGGNFNLLGESFSTASNMAGQFRVASNPAETNEMPGLTTDAAFQNLPAGTDNFFYEKDFLLGGGTGSNLFEPWELESLLRPFDNDANLSPGRLEQFIDLTKANSITTDSFEVNVPAVVIAPGRRLNEILLENNITSLDDRSALIAELLPRDLRLGGKLNLNRSLGNGLDDGGAPNVVDDALEASAVQQQTRQLGAPVMDLDNQGDDENGDELARHLLAKDIYITFLIACGDRAPVDFTSGLPAGQYSETFTTAQFPGLGDGTPSPALTSEDYEYRKMVAQFAVNVVDFKDADSIMTPFEFDLQPFDPGGWEVDGDVSTSGGEMDRLVVWGAERPALLLTETFAFHDRQTQDLQTDTGGNMNEVADGDLDWDSVNAPISTAAFEIYNPWVSSSDMYQSPRELGPNAGIDLGLESPDGSSPVWRIALKRDRTESNLPADIERTIYFSDPASLPATAGNGDRFFPTPNAGVIEPGAYVTLMPTTDPTIDGQVLTASTAAPAGNGIAASRVIRINSPRSLSISDRDGGYADTDGTARGPGEPFNVAIDTPVDNAIEDLDAYNTSGIVDNFRFAYLQRLANPSIRFNSDTNPYLSIDSITVDLLAGNSLNANVGDAAGEVYDEGQAGASMQVIDTTYELTSTERGEVLATTNPSLARRNLFASEDGQSEGSATEMIPATIFTHTFGDLNTSFSGAGTVPFGCLTWNDRPFASVGEIANVPYLPSGLMTYFFNEGARPQSPATISADMQIYHEHIMPFFGEVVGSPTVTDDGHRHLFRFGNPLGITSDIQTAINGSSVAMPMVSPTQLTANRLVRFFDYVETTSLFLGSEVFLTTAGSTTGGMYPIGFYPPFHSLPQFRTPGKININTISDPDEDVWDAVNGGFSEVNFRSGGPALLRDLRDDPQGPTDFGGFFTSAEGRMHVPNVISIAPVKGSAGTPFNVDPTSGEAFFDGFDNNERDTIGNSYFRNDFRQRLTSLTTTRSSVFSIWITLGYFEIDNQGRIGSEVGSETGEVRRNRAFFMVDRSIPVAFEPGRNHNVGQTILTRTIIE